MHDLQILTAIVIIFGVGLIVARMFHVLRAPSIIGFLFAGVLIGPSGLGLIAQEDVRALSEVGLILLLFTVGVELSPEPLVKMGRRILTLSLIQIGATIVCTATVLVLLTDWPLSTVLLLGVVVSLSSTAIVLKQLSDRGETDTLAGILSTGTLLIQDVFVIVIMITLPFFALSSGAGAQSLGLLPMVAAMAGILAIALASRSLLPEFIERVVRPGGRELVTLFAVVMACGGAWLAGIVGWSLPLGACIAGLVLAEADERHQIAADILPFRDAFNALFFISLGMLLDVNVAVRHAGILFAAIAATLVAKTVITAGATRAGRWSWRPAIQVGVGLCTVSEFGFVLAREADRLAILQAGVLDGLVVYVLGTMVCGAFLVPIAAPLSAVISRRLGGTIEADPGDASGENGPLRNHIVIAGYGLNGQNLARVLSATQIPFTVIEMNPQSVQQARNDGAQVIVGDAASGTILRFAGLATASGLIVVINDPGATRSIVASARAARHDMYILARTRFISDIETLYRLGADLVIPEEFETSIEIAAHVLKKMDIPDNIVNGQIASVRAGHYAMLRGQPTDRAKADELMRIFQLTATRTHYVSRDTVACGATLAQLDLRAKSGVTVIAVVRSNKPVTNPPPDFELKEEDVLVLVGAHDQLEQAQTLLDEEAGREP